MQLYQRDQVYRLDQQTIQHDLQPAPLLMQKAAAAVWHEILLRWPEITHIVVMAGGGNNGGDAFALAQMAQQQGIRVTLFMLGSVERQSAESAWFRRQFEQCGGRLLKWQGECPDCDLIVDGLLGIGIKKQLDACWQKMIHTLNRQSAVRVSIDIPSGLNADTGNAMPCAIQAHLTVSFIARKIGCLLADGPDYCGEWLHNDLGISSTALATEKPLAIVLDDHIVDIPARRAVNSYKNQFGHVLVVGGDRGMSGAVRLAAMAALRGGAGLVSACVHADNYTVLAAAEPETMVASWDQLPELLQRATLVVVGPGLGHSRQAGALLERIADCQLPMVIDADALQADFLNRIQSRQVVITPHPGEAGRLLGVAPLRIQQDRVDAVAQLTRRWPLTCVLKGSGSLIGHYGEQLFLCANGHSGMASAGMGDVLSGLVAAAMVQGLPAQAAASNAVYVHARAAELFATEAFADCLIASDLINRIATVNAEIRKSRSG